ncbi:MAG TPA: hypothetical protein VGE24_07880, partial [Emticicia sp.]
MKKKLCVSLFLFISITTFGQVIPKGTRFIGGDLNFNVSQVKSNDVVYANTFMLGLSPSITSFTKDNSAFTVSLGYSISTAGAKPMYNQPLEKASLHTMSAGFYLSNYKMFNEKFGVSIRYGGGVGYFFTTTSYDDNDDAKLKGTTVSVSAGPGVIYMLNEKWALEGVTSLVNISANFSKIANQSNFS